MAIFSTVPTLRTRARTTLTLWRMWWALILVFLLVRRLLLPAWPTHETATEYIYIVYSYSTSKCYYDSLIPRSPPGSCSFSTLHAENQKGLVATRSYVSNVINLRYYRHGRKICAEKLLLGMPVCLNGRAQAIRATRPKLAQRLATL